MLITVEETHYTKRDGWYHEVVEVSKDDLLNYMTNLPEISNDNDYSRSVFLGRDEDRHLYTRYYMNKHALFSINIVTLEEFYSLLKKAILEVGNE
jgi:hypothetical protein